MLNKSIYLIGTDGSGKTTYIKKIQKKYNINFEYIWIRSPKIFSKPLMLICRIFRLTNYKYINNVKFGKHSFEKSKFVSHVYPYLQLLDFKIIWYLKKIFIQNNKNMIFDRFSIDTLADIMVSTKKMHLHKTWVGRQFVKSIPENTILLNIYVNEKNIKKRKFDTKFDDNIKLKIKVYKILCDYLNIPLFDNNKDITLVFDEICSYVENK